MGGPSSRKPQHAKRQKARREEQEEESAKKTNGRPQQRWAVGVSKLTLSFSNESLEAEWSRLVEPRQRALWLRSLLSSVLYQALRHAADLVEFGGRRIPRATIAARLFLSVAELTLYALARVELVAPRQVWVATNAILYGMVELAVAASHLSPRIKPSAWLFVTYGVAWFVVPKMSALHFFPACCGSLFIVAWWLSLSLATTRTGRVVVAQLFGVESSPQVLLPHDVQVATTWCDITAGLALTVPVILLFSLVAYSSEKSVKERFVLRSALSHEHNHDVRLALLSSSPASGSYYSGSRFLEKVKNRILYRREDDGNDSEGSSTNVMPVERRRRKASSSSGDVFFSQAALPKKRHERNTAALAAVIPCAMLAALGWFPSAQRLTSQLVMDSLGGVDAAWAALTHVAGLTIFMLVLTRRLRFVILTPLVCLSLLWLTAQLWDDEDDGASNPTAKNSGWSSRFGRGGAAAAAQAPTPSAADDSALLDVHTSEFCREYCGGLGGRSGDRLFYWENTAACQVCFSDYSAPTTFPSSGSGYSLASALRLVGSIVLACSFLFAMGLFAKCVRLFARLVAFARRTLFLYPHLAEDLVGPSSGGGSSCSAGDSETLKKLVSVDRLPRVPAGPAAVAAAVAAESSDDEDGAAGNERSDDHVPQQKQQQQHDSRNAAFTKEPRRRHREVSPPPDESSHSETDEDKRHVLPMLAIGPSDRVCSFCSRDASTKKHRMATHSVPVCSDWARWYLWRAESAERAQRRKSEFGGDDDACAIYDTIERPCCDFASLALDRADLTQQNQSLRNRIAVLEDELARAKGARSSSRTSPNKKNVRKATATTKAADHVDKTLQ